MRHAYSNLGLFKRRSQFLNLVLTIILLLAGLAPAKASEWQFDDVERIVALSDIHGAYEPMVKALRAAAIVDDDLAWSGANSHLVIVGDIVDRGPDSRRVMDLLMELEHQAVAAGGRVHVLIGNHEVMNLSGDLRYVSSAEYAAFAGDEREQDRARWFAAYVDSRDGGDDSPAGLRALFEQRYPKGFFAHRRAFSSTGKYGKWLLSKPVVVVINGTAFVHGGLSPMIAEIGLDGVNGPLRNQAVEYVRQLEVLQDAGILLPTDAFYDHPDILERRMPVPDANAEINEAAAAIKALNDSDLNSLSGPLWYRGNIVCSELIEADKLAAALEAIDANRVVIGHTPTPGRRVLERIDGRIIEIDTGMLNAYYGGSANALIIDQDGISAINQDGGDESTPGPHPRAVGSRPAGTMSAGEIEKFLSVGNVVARVDDELGRDLVTLSDGQRQLTAVFARRSGRNFYPEVAAYRLDRLLKLDMVPVTVLRELDGVEGSLQFNPDDWIDEAGRQQESRGGSAWCPLPEQWNAMSVFDALTYNEGRTARNILYNLDWWQLMLVGHDRAFSTRKGLPASLKTARFDVGNRWKEVISALDEAALQNELGDVLDQKRIAALLARGAELVEAD
jgi:hypothetical protein